MTSGFALFESKIGNCGIAWNEKSLIGVQLPEASESATRLRMQARFPGLQELVPPPSVQVSIRRIRHSLAGNPDQMLDLHLDMSRVPAFNQRVYAVARGIPAGQTLTYGEVARKLGEPGAARAVGQALGRNPFAPVVPCHRVLAAKGKMGGFSVNGGAATKRQMLLIEGGLPNLTPGLFDLPDSDQTANLTQVHERRVDAGVLSVAFLESGDLEGVPVVLLHGFPYDVHAFDEVANTLALTGCRVIRPFLRGYGATRFLSAKTPRSGQQAVLGSDLLCLLNALDIDQAILAGFDWGGRAACIVAALWPERVLGLVTVGGYNIQDIANSGKPLSPLDEHRYWYQYYLHSERGRAGLSQYRREFCKLLWQQWSPNWVFEDSVFNLSSAAFDNPDFVDVVVHSYRHRYALSAGDPSVEDIERQLAKKPRIKVPTICIDGAADGVMPAEGSSQHGRFFSGQYQRRVIASVGHNPAQEAPHEFSAAVIDLL